MQQEINCYCLVHQPLLVKVGMSNDSKNYTFCLRGRNLALSKEYHL